MLLQDKMNALLDKEWEIVVIMHYGRSGSFFLNNLLDGHPSVLTLDPRMGLYLCDILKKAYVDLDRPNLYFKKEIVELVEIIKKYAKLCNKDFNTPKFIDLFEKTILKFECLSRRDIFLLLHFVIYMHDNEDKPIPRKIIYQLHTPSPTKVSSFIQDFPNCKFIQMVREPLETYISHKWHHMYDFVHSNLTKLICYTGIPLFPALRNITKVVRLEELKMFPRETMALIAQYINIPWNDCLLIPSVNNVIKDSFFSGFDDFISKLNSISDIYKIPATELPWFTTQSTRHEKPPLFTPEESEAIEIALLPYYEHWHYTPKWIQDKTSSPLQNEKKALSQLERPYSYHPLSLFPAAYDGRDLFKMEILRRQMNGRVETPLPLLTTDKNLYF